MMVKTQGAADTREGGPVDGVDDSSSGYRFQVPFSFWSPCYIVRAQGAQRAGQPALHVTWESRRDNRLGPIRVKDSRFKMAA